MDMFAPPDWIIIILLVIIIIIVWFKPTPVPPPTSDCQEWKDWAKKHKKWVDDVLALLNTCDCPTPSPGNPDPPPGGWPT